MEHKETDGKAAVNNRPQEYGNKEVYYSQVLKSTCMPWGSAQGS